jgi:hypothetical protein
MDKSHFYIFYKIVYLLKLDQDVIATLLFRKEP